MYYTHELRANLQEWKNRLYKTPYNQFGSQLQFFLKRIENEPILMGLIEEASKKFSIDEKYAKKWFEDYVDEILFDYEDEQASCFYHLSKYLIKEVGANQLIYLTFLSGTAYEERKISYIEMLINPVIEFFHDRIDNSNSILYLLEKYKKRVEWFKRKELFEKYKTATKEYEQVLEDDFRLFLFDQGIDYPFSTPKSFSGRADLVGLIDTEEPLIAEIKIYDSEKGYRKDRIFSGLSQIVKYTNDYNKDCGYLVVFNIDESEIVFKFSVEQKRFPPRITINNKTYYFVVVNLYHDFTASKVGKTKTVEINEDELLNELKK